jgi:hypothetical protein
MPVFKQNYCEDIVNLLSAPMESADEKARNDYKDKIRPIFEQKTIRLETQLKKQYERISVLLGGMMKNEKTLILEASVVLMVAYFEDFLKNLFVNQVNINPKKALPFIGKQLRIADLKEFGFDLSKKMGSLISERMNFQNLAEIENNFNKSFRTDIYNKNMELKKDIEQLFQARHLIVHNNGVIDKKYCAATGTKKDDIGKKLKISEVALLRFKNACLKVGANICKKSPTH